MPLGWETKPVAESDAQYFVRRAYCLSAEEEELFDCLAADFREETRRREFKKREDTKKFLSDRIKHYCSREKIQLDKERTETLAEAAELTLAGLGPFDLLLADDSVEEIAFVGTGKPVFVYQRGVGWLESNCFVHSDELGLELANKMARPLGRRLTMQSPRLNASLAGGERLHASAPPLSLNGVEITLRKFRRQPFSVPELAGNGVLSFRAAAALSLAVFADTNVAVVGNTGSGKTTFLNSLFSFIPLAERVVVTEETPELSLPHAHVARVVANKELGIGLAELVEDTLRMRPDRVVIGEVRGREEAQALFDALLAGQARGTFFTFHGRSASEALSRLSSLGASKEELNSIDLVIALRRIPRLSKEKKASELRRVTEITLNCGGKPSTIYSIDGVNSLREHSLQPLFKRISSNYDFSSRELSEQLAAREAFLRTCFSQRLSFDEFTTQFQRKFLGASR